MGSGALTRGRAASSTPLIDPRLRDRRIEVARDQGRKRLRRVLVLFVLLALVGAAVAATRSSLLDVDRIEVRGAGDATGPADEVRAASGIVQGQPLLDVDLDGAAARIEELPWVASATVERSWPSEVRIRVSARTPVAVVTDGESWLVDETGRVLGPATVTQATTLPTLDADPVEAGRALASGGRTAAAVVGGLPGPLRAEVESLDHGRDGVQLQLRDGIEVVWGDEGQASAKAEALRVLLGQADRDEFVQIDVSVPRASTITFRDEDGE